MLSFVDNVDAKWGKVKPSSLLLAKILQIYSYYNTICKKLIENLLVTWMILCIY